MSNKFNPDQKCRSWWWVARDSHLPKNWLSILKERPMPCFAIIHDQDFELDENDNFVLDDDGNRVKEGVHLHVLDCYNSGLRLSTALNNIPSEFSIPYCEPVPSRPGGVRYFLHLGQKNKHAYEWDDLKIINGATVNRSEVYNIGFTDIFKLIEELNISNYAELLAFCVEFKPQLVNYCCGHCNVIRAYLSEKRYLA